MKTKKMFLLFAAFIFAAVAGYNIHMAQSNQNSDVSLADIAVMAQADGESGGGGVKHYKHDCSHYNNFKYCSVAVTHLPCDVWVKCPD